VDSRGRPAAAGELMAQDYRYIPLPASAPPGGYRATAARREQARLQREREAAWRRESEGLGVPVTEPGVLAESTGRRERPPTSWEMVGGPTMARAGGSLVEALDAPPSGMRETLQRHPDMPYTTPLRMLNATTAVIPKAVGTLASTLRGTPLSETTIDPMAPVDEQTNWVSELQHQGVPDAWAVGLGTTADFLLDPMDWATGGALGAATLPATLGRAVKALTKRGATGAAQRASVASGVLESLGSPERLALAEEIAQRFPRLDSYAKPIAFLSPRSLMNRAPDLSPSGQQFVEAVAAQTKAPIAPLELQALARGETYVPERTVRARHRLSPEDADVKRPKRFVGAPDDVRTVSHERTRLKNYLDQVEAGTEGANWYDTSGAATLFAMGDDVAHARQFTDEVAITSPSTAVDVNVGFALESDAQRRAGVPIKSGRWPKNMSPQLEQVGRGGAVSGKKRLPFSQQIQLGGGFAAPGSPRSVHDIWDMEAWGYSNPDGTPLRRGARDTEHRWMDSMTDRAIKEANRRRIGGRSDWTTGRLQAAAWTGSKINSGTLVVGAQVDDIASAFAKRQIELSREAVPGRTAQHLQGLEGDALDAYARDQFGIDIDPQGRSRLAMEQRVPVAEGGPGPGVFEGVTSPGYQARAVVPIKQDPRGGSRVLPEAMREAEKVEAMWAWSRAQDAGAGSRLTRWPTQKELETWIKSEPDEWKHPMRGAELPLGRTPTAAEMQQVDALMTAAAGGQKDKVAVVFIPGKGIRLGNLAKSPLSPKDFDAAATEAAKLFQTKAVRGRFDSFYLSNDWGDKTLGQEFWQYLPESGSRAEQELKRQVAAVASRDAAVLTANPSITSNPLIQEIRDVYAQGGIDAMRQFATARGLPLATVLLALGFGAQSPASGDGRPGISPSGAETNRLPQDEPHRGYIG